MNFRLRNDHSTGLFLYRTISAQIHMLGLILIIAGGFVLLPLASRAGTRDLLACTSFILSGAIIFGVSSTYHFLHDGCVLSRRLTALFEYTDHFGIYLFIAGTYSPIVLRTVKEPWISILLSVIWILAILGIAYTALKQRLPKILQSRALYTSLFVIMGWTFVVRVGDLVANSSRLELCFLAAGTLSYMIGAVIYATRRPRLFFGVFGYHELWHVMVLLGASFHYAAILAFYW